MKNILRIIAILLIISTLVFKNCSKSTPTRHTTQPPNTTLPTTQTANEIARNSAIPLKVYEVLKYVQEHHQAPDGYVGGRKFGNFEGNLPKNDATGKRINYQEWDVNPHLEHKNRGTERLITGSDGKAYFTNNHYKSFTEIK
jgi:guanyl-specific ribonuclease Sa